MFLVVPATLARELRHVYSHDSHMLVHHLHRIDNGSIANIVLAFQEVLFTDEGANILLGCSWYGTHGRSTCSTAARNASYRWRLYSALPSALVCERATRTQPAMTWRSSGVVFPTSRPGMSSSRSIQLSVEKR